MNPLLLLAFTASTKVKKDRDRAAEITRIKAKEAKENEIKNIYELEGGGLTVVDSNKGVPDGSKYYGSKLFGSKDIIKPKQDAEPVYAHPKLGNITQKEFNLYKNSPENDKGGFLQFDKSTFVGIKVGNKIDYDALYLAKQKAIIEKENKAKEPKKGGLIYYGANGLPLTKDQIADGATVHSTATSELDAKGNKIATETPKKFERKTDNVKADPKVQYRAIAEDGSNIVGSSVKEINEKAKEQGTTVKNKNIKREVVTETNITGSDAFPKSDKAAETNKAKTVYYVAPLGGLREEFKDQLKANPNFLIKMTEDQKDAAESGGSGVARRYQNFNKDGEPGDIKNISSINAAEKSNNVANNDKITASVTLKTSKKDINDSTKPVNETLYFYDKQEPLLQLGRWNYKFKTIPGLSESGATEKGLGAVVAGEFKRWYNKTNRVTGVMMNHDNTDPFQTFYNNFPELAKIPGIKNEIEIATGFSTRGFSQEVKDYKNNLDNGSNGKFKHFVTIEKLPDGTDKIFDFPYQKEYVDEINDISSIVQASTENELNKALIPLIAYDKDPKNPTKELRVNGKLVPSAKQPILELIRSLKQEVGTVPIKFKDGTKKIPTSLEVLKNMLNSRRQSFIPSTAQVREVNEMFAAAVQSTTVFDGDYLENGISLIESFVTKQGNSIDNAIVKATYGDSVIPKKEVDKLTDETNSSIKGLDTADSLLMSYHTSDGKFINISSGAGNFIKLKNGVIALVATAIDTKFGTNLTGGLIKDATMMEAAFTSPFDLEESYKSLDDTPASLKARAYNASVLDGIKQRLRDPSKLDIIDPETKQQYSNEIKRKIALREYNKFMLAYQLAGAIQGGTGGRTISDQDVQNILKALNFGTFVEAKQEYATIKAARNMLNQIIVYNEAILNGPPARRYAALMAKKMLRGSKINVLFQKNIEGKSAYIASRMEQKGSEASRKGSNNLGTETDLQKKKKNLEVMNELFDEDEVKE